MSAFSSPNNTLKVSSKTKRENSENIPPKPKISVTLTKHGVELSKPSPKQEHILQSPNAHIEKEIFDFIKQQIHPLKERRSSSIDLDSLKKNISKALTESNTNSGSSSKAPTRRGLTFSTQASEEDLKGGSQDIQAVVASYEDKIEDYKSYILELEAKINYLTDEFEKLEKSQQKGRLSVNNSSQSKLQMPTNDFLQLAKSIHVRTDKLDSLIENEQSLFEENIELKNELEQVLDKNGKLEKTIFTLQDEIKQYRDSNSTQLEQISSLQLAITDLKVEYEKNTSLISSEKSDLQSEITRQANIIQSLKNQEEISLKIIEDLKNGVSSPRANPDTKNFQNDLLQKQIQDYKTVNEILQNKCDRLSSQIQDLEISNQEANYKLTLAREQIDLLQSEASARDYDELKTKAAEAEALQNQIKSLTRKHEEFVAKIENDSVIIDQLRSEVAKQTPQKIETMNFSLKGLDEVKTSTFETPSVPLSEFEALKKEYEEKIKRINEENENNLTSERQNYKVQMEKYGSTLDILSSKIKFLAGVNENLLRDQEIIKTEFHNYRLIAWSVLDEISKALSQALYFYSLTDKEFRNIYDKFSEAGNAKEYFMKIQAYIFYIERMVEEKKRMA